MGIHKKLQHFLSALKCSAIGLITIVILVLFCCLLFIYVPIENDSQIVPFFVGIIASIIASIVLNISSKYGKSCSRYMWILDQTEIFVSYIEATYKDMPNINQYRYRFELWHFVTNLREKASDLTYTKDFDALSRELSEVIKATNGKDNNPIREALDGLINTKKLLTE